jgi:hypothetical protein
VNEKLSRKINSRTVNCNRHISDWLHEFVLKDLATYTLQLESNDTKKQSKTKQTP